MNTYYTFHGGQQTRPATSYVCVQNTHTRRLHEPIDNHTVKWDAWASIEVLKEIVSALIFLHEHKILHGDLKAANVLLASSNEDRRRWIAKVRHVHGQDITTQAC